MKTGHQNNFQCYSVNATCKLRSPIVGGCITTVALILGKQRWKSTKVCNHTWTTRVHELFFFFLNAVGRGMADKLEVWDWTSLVVQWLRICLSMQRTRVGSLVWEDSMCNGATKPAHNYWSTHVCALQQEELQQWKSQAPQLESSPCSLQPDSAATKTQHSQN